MNEMKRPTTEILASHLPELLTADEKLIWLLGDLMNAVENYFGAENPKRLGHINSSAIRIIDEIIQPLRDENMALVATLRMCLANLETAHPWIADAVGSLPNSYLEAIEAATAALSRATAS